MEAAGWVQVRIGNGVVVIPLSEREDAFETGTDYVAWVVEESQRSIRAMRRDGETPRAG